MAKKKVSLDLGDEIKACIVEMLRGRNDIRIDWVVQSILSNRPNIEGADAIWYEVNAREHIKVAVGAVARSFKLTTSDLEREGPAQLDLGDLGVQGFDRLQPWYQLSRNGHSSMVWLASMSQVEIRDKIREMGKSRDGLNQHIEQLQRYLEMRIDRDGEDPTP